MEIKYLKADESRWNGIHVTNSLDDEGWMIIGNSNFKNRVCDGRNPDL